MVSVENEKHRGASQEEGLQENLDPHCRYCGPGSESLLTPLVKQTMRAGCEAKEVRAKGNEFAD